MPGPVSDSYDPVYSTGARRAVVNDAARELRDKMSDYISAPPDYIVDVCERAHEDNAYVMLSDRERRLIRFAMGVLLDEEDH